MYLRKVISFGDSWAKLDENILQIDEIKGFIAKITLDSIRAMPDRFRNEVNDDVNPRKLYRCWEEIINESDWVSSRRYLRDDRENQKYYGFLGDCSEDVSVRLITHRDLMNRWLFSTTPIAYKNSVINIPIAILLNDDADRAINEDKRRGFMSATFERTVEELQALAPLSQSHPFVVMGISFEDGDLEIMEIESELGIAEKQIVINRSIEFPPEFHSAGIGILSYFGTVLREKYPEQEAKVKIEQDGHVVRMIIETKDGDKETIEKALQEYELVVTGERAPETLYEDNALKILELKTELRVAYTKIEAQRDLLIHKGEEISTLKSLFENSLTQSNQQPLALSVSPVINVTSTQTTNATINNEILDISDEIKSLIDKSGEDAGTELRLLDLNSSIENIEPTATPEVVKSSVGLTKLKRFIDDANDTGSDVNKFFENISGGIDKLRNLGCRYNSLAEWCGAPQIPSALLR